MINRQHRCLLSLTVSIGLCFLLAIERKVIAIPQQSIEIEQNKNQYRGIVGKVDKIAEQITVRISTPNNLSQGSGAIIARENNTYYVATAKHVVKDKQDYKIVTPDGKQHPLDSSTIETSNSYDLAIFSFQSRHHYQVANLGKYTVGANREQVVFVSGFPRINNQSPQRIITGGKVIQKDERDGKAKESYSLLEGQELLYSNISYGGMSGGAVLDREGRLIGIHAASEDLIDENTSDGFRLGFSLGIPIRDALGFFHQTQLDVSRLALTSNSPTEVNKGEWKEIESQLLATSQPDTEEIAVWMNYGNQLWRYEQYEDAVRAFQRVIALDSNYHPAYYSLGLVYRALGSRDYRQQPPPLYSSYYQKAVDFFQLALKINSSPYYYWRWLGFARTELKQYDLALAAYDRAIENADSARDFVLYQERGDINNFAGRYGEAIADYTQAAKIKPHHPWIYNARGIAYRKLKQYDNAIADFNRAISLNPFLYHAYNNRGIVYSELEQYNKAIADYSKSIEINPENRDAYYNRSIAYGELKQNNKAITDLTRAIDLRKDADSYYNRGTIYDRLEQYEKAIDDFSQTIAIAPEFIDAYFNRGIVYKNLQQYDLALADLTTVIKLESNRSDTYINRGVIYSELGQYYRAIDDFDRVIKLAHQNIEVYLYRAFAYVNLQQNNKAIADFSKIIELDPDNAFAYFNRGNIYGKTKQYSKAIDDFDRVIKLEPENTQAYYLRGLTFNSLGKIEAAKKDALMAIELYQQQGQEQEAQTVINFLETIK